MKRRTFLMAPCIALASNRVKGITITSPYKSNHKAMSYFYGLESIESAVGGFRAGSLILLAARPSMGKTSLAFGIENYLMRTRPKTFSVLHLTACKTQEKFLSVKLRNNKLEQVASLSAREMIEAYCYEKSEWRDGLGLIIIDNMEEFYQYQGNTIKAKKSLNWAKQLASRFQISFIITANLNQDIVVREDHRPHISDLTFANRLPSQIDSAILLYRDELYRDSFVVDSKNYGLKGMTEIIVINSNNYQYGPILIPMDPFI